MENLGDVIRCIECKKELDADSAFAFTGNLACETCVRKYYTQQDDSLPMPLRRRYSPETIVEELIIRKKDAERMLKQLERRERRQESRL